MQNLWKVLCVSVVSLVFLGTGYVMGEHKAASPQITLMCPNTANMENDHASVPLPKGWTSTPNLKR